VRPVGDEGVRLQDFVEAYLTRAAFYGACGMTPLISAFRWWMGVLAGWQVLETQYSSPAILVDEDDYLACLLYKVSNFDGASDFRPDGCIAPMGAAMDMGELRVSGLAAPQDSMDVTAAWVEGAGLLLRPDLSQQFAAMAVSSSSDGFRCYPEGPRSQWLQTASASTHGKRSRGPHGGLGIMLGVSYRIWQTTRN
jgi:hypothetical protein